MSVITAIFQAIFQAIAWIFPISESGHSSLFHEFAGRTSGACSALTGVIHIGIAVGIFVAMYKPFISQFKQITLTFKDLFQKKLDIKNPKPARRFVYMTIISFVPMLLWLIPAGKNGNFYQLLNSTSHNGNVFGEGIFLVVTALMVLVASKQSEIVKTTKNATLPCAIVIGIASVFLVPVSGLSLIAGVLAISLLFGVSKNLSFRYALSISVPVLLIMGIIQISNSVTSVGVFSGIVGFVIAVAFAFVVVRLLKWFVKNNKLSYFAYYDFALGAIAFVVGFIQLVTK